MKQSYISFIQQNNISKNNPTLLSQGQKIEIGNVQDQNPNQMPSHLNQTIKLNEKTIIQGVNPKEGEKDCQC